MKKLPKAARNPKKPPTLHAFLCMSHNDPETSEIIFAKSNVEARRRHTTEQGADFSDASVTRQKHFDKYAPGPVPPKALIEDGWFFDCWACGRKISLSEDDIWADSDCIPDMKEIAEHNADIDHELAEFDRKQAELDAKDPKTPVVPSRYPRSDYDSPRYRRAQIEGRKYDPLLDPKALRFAGRAVFCHIQCQQSHYAEEAKINLAHKHAEEEAAIRYPEGTGFESKRYPFLEPSVVFHIEGLTYPVCWNPKRPEDLGVSNADKEAWDVMLKQRAKTPQPA